MQNYERQFFHRKTREIRSHVKNNNDCPALRTPNAVFNKVLEHKREFLNKYVNVVKLDYLFVVRRPKKWLQSMKSCKIYVFARFKLSIVCRNPQENLIYLTILDCSPDEMQSLINIMRILMILKLYLNKNFHVTE